MRLTSAGIGLRKHYTNKTSGSDEIPTELYEILKDDGVKVLHSVCQQIWKIQQWSQDWKKSVFIPLLKKGSAKKSSDYQIIVLTSYANKVMLKILQARLQPYLNWELPHIQARFRKSIEIRDQIANIYWIIEKAREFPQKIYFCLFDYLKALDCVDHSKLWKILFFFKLQIVKDS